MARVRELIRFVPQLAVLFMRLARDRRVPRLRRLWVLAMGAYLASPIDLIPDFIPVMGQLDDAALLAAALAYTVRLAGAEVVREQWPGSERGLRVVLSLARQS